MENKTAEELALIELTKSVRTIQRQFKLMKGITFSERETKILKEIITAIEKEFSLFKI